MKREEREERREGLCVGCRLHVHVANEWMPPPGTARGRTRKGAKLLLSCNGSSLRLPTAHSISISPLSRRHNKQLA